MHYSTRLTLSLPLGYKTVKGTRLTANELRTLFQGLVANDLLDYDYILTGYMGSGELLQVVAEYVRLIKSKCPHVQYSERQCLHPTSHFVSFFSVCDPVIGDDNKLVSQFLALPMSHARRFS